MDPIMSFSSEAVLYNSEYLEVRRSRRSKVLSLRLLMMTFYTLLSVRWRRSALCLEHVMVLLPFALHSVLHILTCTGFFFYKSDNQETDIEIRTSYPDQIFLTNQKSSRTAAASTFDTTSPSGISSGFHEYRFDWLKGVTKFYIDGKYIGAIKKNVPTVPGSMVW
jgi:hypothetical protein